MKGGTRLNGSLIAAGIVGFVAVSYITYYLYRRSRRRRLLNYLKRIYNNDHELYSYDDEEPYSDEDDFYRDNAMQRDRYKRAKASVGAFFGRMKNPKEGNSQSASNDGSQDNELVDNIEGLADADGESGRSHRAFSMFKAKKQKTNGTNSEEGTVHGTVMMKNVNANEDEKN